MGNNSIKNILAVFWKGVYSKRKEFAPFGANSFLLEYTPFRRNLVYREANRKSQKLAPLYKMAENLPCMGVQFLVSFLRWLERNVEPYFHGKIILHWTYSGLKWSVYIFRHHGLLYSGWAMNSCGDSLEHRRFEHNINPWKQDCTSTSTLHIRRCLNMPRVPGNIKNLCNNSNNSKIS